MNGNNRNNMGGNDYNDNNNYKGDDQEEEFIMDPFYEDYELEDNTNDKANTPTNMEDVLKMLMASSSSSSSSTAPPSKVPSSSISSPIITEPTSYELSKLISQMESLLLPNTETKHSDHIELDNWEDPDAPFIDPDIYANYRSNLNPDGSLAFNSPSGKSSKDYSLQYPGNQSFNKKQRLDPSSMLDSSPDLPKSYFSNSIPPRTSTNGPNNLNTDGWSLEDVILQSKPPSTDQIDEDMHTKIMAEEEGFLQQSKRFQEFLSVSGSSSILDPENQNLAYEIRNQRRHDEQAQQSQKLEQEIEKFENSLREIKKQQQQQQQQQLGNDDSTTSKDIHIKLISCSQCGCPLSGVEMDRYRQRSGGRSICQICEGEAIAEQSDMRFRNAHVPQVPVSSTTPIGQNLKPWNGKEMTQRTNYNSQQQQRVEISIPIRGRNQGSHDEERQLLRKQDNIRNSTRSRLELSRNSRVLQQNPQQSLKQQQDQQQRQVMALQQQVEWYKRQWKVAEQRYRAAEEEADHWRKRVEELEELLLLGNDRHEELDDERDDDVVESWIPHKEEAETDNVYFWNTDADEKEYPSSSSQ